MKKIRFFVYLLISIIVISSCITISDGGILYFNPDKNLPLPKEIKLNKKIKIIIDSTFNCKSSSESIDIVTKYYLNESILDSAIISWYKNDTIIATNLYICDSFGYFIKTTYKSKKTDYYTEYTRDSLGYTTLMKTIENNRISSFKYKNYYENGQISRIITFNKNHELIEESNFKYNSNRNLINEWGASFGRSHENKYFYDKNDDIKYYLTYRDGVIQDSVVNSNKNNQLVLQERYIPSSPDYYRMGATEYYYDEKGNLTAKKDIDSDNETRYIKYDSYGNWKERQLINKYGVHRKLVRYFILK